MSYHISTYGYTHKMFGCKRTRLDFGKPYRKEKTKNAKMLCILAFFIVLKFGVPKRNRTGGGCAPRATPAAGGTGGRPKGVV